MEKVNDSLVNVYKVILNGNIVKRVHFNKKKLLSYCVRLSMNPRNYVELWYYHGDGSRTLVRYWN